jgi:hypothetical protein
MPRKKIPLVEIETAPHQETYTYSLPESDRKAGKKGAARIMYIENKSGGLSGGEACIGRVTFSKTGSTIYYKNRAFGSLRGRGYKANYAEAETGEEYWISGPKKDGSDRLYAERVPVIIDEDVREEYWTLIRNLPEKKNQKHT